MTSLSKTLQFSTIIDGVNLKKDGTLSIKLGTQELSPDDTAQIFAMGNKQVWCALSETLISKDKLNIPESLMEFKSDKSPSQRLRNTLFVYWKEKVEGTGTDWDEYYKKKMESIIDYIKEKLD